jgi:hypothetical protein
MAGHWGNVSRNRLMENITLLWTLNKIIEPPRENVICDDKKSWRQLPIEREKTVADLLAFLSAINDDNCNVMAVCIEENPCYNYLTIRMASNTRDCLGVKNSLDKVVRILEIVHSRGKFFYRDPFY